MGASVENQPAADERVPKLLGIPARVRFLSCEPLLGTVNLRDAFIIGPEGGWEYFGSPRNMIHLVIVGGESGKNARPMHPAWARSIRDQCKAAGVAYWFKQWGEWFPRAQWEHNPELILPDDADAYVEGPRTCHLGGYDPETMHRVGTKAAGHLLDGVEHHEMPNDTKETN